MSDEFNRAERMWKDYFGEGAFLTGLFSVGTNSDGYTLTDKQTGKMVTEQQVRDFVQDLQDLEQATAQELAGLLRGGAAQPLIDDGMNRLRRVRQQLEHVQALLDALDPDTMRRRLLTLFFHELRRGNGNGGNGNGGDGGNAGGMMVH